MSKLMFAVLLIGYCASLAFAQNDYHRFEISGGYSHDFVDGPIGSQFETFVNGGARGLSGTRTRDGAKGFEASAVFNFARYFGVKFDFSAHSLPTRNRTLPATNFIKTMGFPTVLTVPAFTSDARGHFHNFLGGVQIKDNSQKTRFKPFAHALFGIARQSSTFEKLKDPSSLRIAFGTDTISQKDFAMALGGGLDIRVHRRFDLRVIQFDYNPVFAKAHTIIAQGDIRNFTFDPSFNSVAALHNTGTPKRTQNNFRIGFGIVFH